MLGEASDHSEEQPSLRRIACACRCNKGSFLMRKFLVMSFAAVAFSVGTGDAMAIKTKTITGAAIGAGAGAVVAGPPGAVVGGAAGAVIGGPNLPPARRHCWKSHGVRHCR
jgi:osmotically inducible lipoprotein OsmB